MKTTKFFEIIIHIRFTNKLIDLLMWIGLDSFINLLIHKIWTESTLYPAGVLCNRMQDHFSPLRPRSDKDLNILDANLN